MRPSATNSWKPQLMSHSISDATDMKNKWFCNGRLLRRKNCYVLCRVWLLEWYMKLLHCCLIFEKCLSGKFVIWSDQYVGTWKKKERKATNYIIEKTPADPHEMIISPFYDKMKVVRVEIITTNLYLSLLITTFVMFCQSNFNCYLMCFRPKWHLLIVGMWQRLMGER